MKTMVQLEVDLDEFDDEDIRAEFIARGLSAFDEADARRLADLIAEGRRDDALSLLAKVAPFGISPSTVKRLADQRHGDAWTAWHARRTVEAAKPSSPVRTEGR